MSPRPSRGNREAAGGGRDVLILRALGLGDFLTGVPAYRALRDAFPDRRIVLAARPELHELARLSGAVDAVVPCRGLDDRIRVPGNAMAVNLHGRGPQSHRLLLSTSPARLLAFRHDLVAESSLGPPWIATGHEVRRWCTLLRWFDVRADERALDLELPEELRPAVYAGCTVIHPGAASAGRRWPAERWRCVAAAERASGARVVVTGSDRERPLARWIADGAHLMDSDVLAGRTDLRSLTGLVAGAGVVVSGDTGVSHLATAVGTPSVTLFGPTPPAAWGPPPERRRHRVIWKGAIGDPFADVTSLGLMAIQPDEVLRLIAELRRLPTHL